MSHAKVTTFAEFTQRLIKIFDEKKSKGEEPSSPLKETCTSADTTMEDQPSSSKVGGTNTLKEGTLSALQYVPKFHQGMPKFPFPIVSENLMEVCIPFHDQGSTQTANLE